MKTVIVGASPNTNRYAYHAAVTLKDHHHEFVPLGIKEGSVLGKEILNIRDFPIINDVHTVTLYLRPDLQIEYYDYLISLNPTRIIFNPGTENPEFEKLAIKSGIKTEEACTLVMLRTGQF